MVVRPIAVGRDPEVPAVPESSVQPGSRPLPDGERQEPGGWNRIVVRVDDLPSVIEAFKTAGLMAFREGYEQGLTCDVLAARLLGGSRSAEAVAARARRLGLVTYARSWSAHEEAALRSMVFAGSSVALGMYIRQPPTPLPQTLCASHTAIAA